MVVALERRLEHLNSLEFKTFGRNCFVDSEIENSTDKFQNGSIYNNKIVNIMGESDDQYLGS